MQYPYTSVHDFEAKLGNMVLRQTEEASVYVCRIYGISVGFHVTIVSHWPHVCSIVSKEGCQVQPSPHVYGSSQPDPTLTFDTHVFVTPNAN